jgi:hypothetical protein
MLPVYQPLHRPRVNRVYKATEDIKADLDLGDGSFRKNQTIPADSIFVLLDWVDTGHNYAEIVVGNQFYNGAWILGKWRKLTDAEAQEYVTNVMSKI